MVLFYAQYKHVFWNSVHTCLWNEPPQVSEKVVFAEFDWKCHIFLNIKTEEWDLKVLLFNYWNGLVLGLVQTCFLEVGGYIPLKRATAGFWERYFYWIWLKILHLFKYKNRGAEPRNFLLNYWNDLVLG